MKRFFISCWIIIVGTILVIKEDLIEPAWQLVQSHWVAWRLNRNKEIKK
jgi:hypothetical protein